MKAVVCEAFGPPEDLNVRELEVPEVAADSLLVRVEAAGVGFVDGLLIQGLYQIKPELPFVPGSEFYGEVTATGNDVDPSWLGQRIIGLATGGTFADYTTVKANQAVAIPAKIDRLDAATAAGLFINYATALYGWRDCGALQPGETVLVLGAAGGVGSAAVAVAKAMGATVIAAASSAAKRAAAETFGADATVDYRADNWREPLKRIAPGGINLIYDPVGGDEAETAFRTLSPGGRHLVVGFASGTIPKLALNLPLLKRASIVGVDWGGEMRAHPEINQELMGTVLEWIATGKLVPAAVEVRPMADFRSALTDQLAGNIVGKLVLESPL